MRRLFTFFLLFGLVAVSTSSTGSQGAGLLDNGDNDGAEEEDTSFAQSSGRGEGVVRKQEGSYSTQASGGRAAIVRSLNLARARIFAAKTAQAQERGGSWESSYRNTDLHTAYRLPLQRLSDAQLGLLLHRYGGGNKDGQEDETAPTNNEKFSRPAMINQLQELMLNRSQSLRLIRPTLLTNINVLPGETVIEEDNNLPSSKPILESEDPHSRALGANSFTARSKGGRKVVASSASVEELPQEQIQEHRLSLEEQLKSSNQMDEGLDEVGKALKERYEATRLEFLEKLGQLNSLKQKLLAKKKRGKEDDHGETTPSTSTQQDEGQEAETTQQPLEMIESTKEWRSSTELDTSTPTTDLNEEERGVLRAYSTEPIRFRDPMSMNRLEENKSENPPESSTDASTLSSVARAIDQGTFSPTQEAEIGTTTPLSTDQSENQIIPEESSSTTKTTESVEGEPASEVSPSSFAPTEAYSSSETQPNVDETTTTTSPSSLPMRPGESRLIKKLMGILQAKLHHQASGAVAKANQRPVIGNQVRTAQLVANHEEGSMDDASGIGEVARSPLLRVEKTLKGPAPRANPIPKIFSSNTATAAPDSFFLDGEGKNGQGVGMDSSSNSTGNSQMGHNEDSNRGEIISEGQANVQERKKEKVAGGGVKFAMKRVGDLSASELEEDLKEEFEASQANNSTKKSTLHENDRSEPGEEKDEEMGLKEMEDSSKPNDEQGICDAIACDFERGDMCLWQPSQDQLQPTDRHYLYRLMHRRMRRVVLDNDIIGKVQRTWHNWRGRYRNRLTGIARAQVFSESNQRFAASYVQPNQRSTLTANILSGQQETIRFRAWEATRDVRLRVCCDSTENCVFETEKGVRRGSRRWREFTATCPKGTQKIFFECSNNGVFQGACGIDNVHLLNQYCPSVIPLVGVEENRRKMRI